MRDIGYSIYGARAFPKCLVAVCLVTGLLILSSPVVAQQVVLKNDSFADVGDAAILPGFIGGERAAAWLTSSCDGNMVAVRILWLSVLGGAPDIVHDSVVISEVGVFPIPGAQMESISGPQFSDGFINEFPLTTPVPVLQGSTYVVFLEFDTPPPGTGPSVVADTDGCQQGMNGIYSLPTGTWVSSCSVGVSGDFVIRAVVDCDDVGLIFRDGFESGGSLDWSETAP